MSDNLEKSAKLIRHELGSIDFSDIEELQNIKLKNPDARSRAADVEIFYRNIFKNVIKLFIQEQLEFMGKEIKDTEQFLFARGTINGLFLIKDWFEEEEKLSLSRNDPKEPKTTNPFPEV